MLGASGSDDGVLPGQPTVNLSGNRAASAYRA